MKLTPPSLNKIGWLVHNGAFKKAPLRTSLRIIHWEYVRFRNRPLAYRFDDSFQVRLLPNEGVSRLTYYFGVSEPEVFRFLDSYLGKGMVFVDVGANIGLHSLYCAKRVGRSGKVYSFEVSQQTFARLMENIVANGVKNLEAYNFAVGEESGDAALIEDNNDTSRTYVSSEPITSKTPIVHRLTVKTRSLDSVVVDRQIGRIDYLKIDVEGFEYQVLKGAVRTIEEIRPEIIQMELDDASASRNSSSAKEVINFLTSRGYDLFGLNASENKLVRALPDQVPGYNSFFVSDKSMNKLAKYLA